MKGDYEVFVKFTKADVNDLFEKMKEIISEIKQLL